MGNFITEHWEMIMDDETLLLEHWENKELKYFTPSV